MSDRGDEKGSAHDFSGVQYADFNEFSEAGHNLLEKNANPQEQAEHDNIEAELVADETLYTNSAPKNNEQAGGECMQVDFHNNENNISEPTERYRDMSATDNKLPSTYDHCSNTDSISIASRTGKQVLRDERGMIVPEPFSLSQSHRNKSPASQSHDTYVPLAVSIKAFEDTRSLPYTKLSNSTRSKLVRPEQVKTLQLIHKRLAPTKPKSPVLLTSLRSRNHATMGYQNTFSQSSSRESSYSHSTGSKIRHSTKTTYVPRKPTVIVSFNMLGDAISREKRKKLDEYKEYLEIKNNEKRKFRANPVPRYLCSRLNIGKSDISSSISESAVADVIEDLKLKPKNIENHDFSVLSEERRFRARPAPDFTKVFIPKKAGKSPVIPVDIVLNTAIRARKRLSLCSPSHGSKKKNRSPNCRLRAHCFSDVSPHINMDENKMNESDWNFNPMEI